jgi:serine/threonine protein kinase
VVIPQNREDKGEGRVDWLGLGIRLEEQIGTGTYSVVYAANCVSDSSCTIGGGRPLAVKVTKSQEESIHQLAEREWNFLRELSHPNIVEAYKFEREKKECALFMFRAAEGSLHRRVTTEGPLAPDVGRRICRGMFSALVYIHSQRIFHLDINPRNLLLATDGSPVLADFGSAQRGSEGGSLGALGTPLYAAPEAVKESAHSADLLDVWGAGCCLLAAHFAGVPWDTSAQPSEVATIETSRAELVHQLESFAEVQLPRMREQTPELPGAFWELLARCLTPELQRGTAREVAEMQWCGGEDTDLALTAEELADRRHNPYIGTEFHAPPSPTWTRTSEPGSGERGSRRGSAYRSFCGVHGPVHRIQSDQYIYARASSQGESADSPKSERMTFSPVASSHRNSLSPTVTPKPTSNRKVQP